MDSPYIIINDRIVAQSDAVISVQERGFLFGDGVFETCRIIKGKIYDWSAHLARLKAGLNAIKIAADLNNLEQNCAELIAKNALSDGVLRIYVSRGIGGAGYLPDLQNCKPLIVIETKPLPSLPNAPIKLWVSNITKPSLKSLPVNYKIAQGLNSTLAKIEAAQNHCFDALLLNDAGQICESAAANIFWVKGDVLYTPDEKCGLLCGTMRQRIIDLSPVKLLKVAADLASLLNADEAFISNSVFGVLAIDNIEPMGKSFASKQYGKLFKKLIDEDMIA
ncbi:MAG: aminotransferase class IV [Proteobacteria bacterium]|nr:aminotransferase class IV [Pseudomonadota bacterium]